MVQARILISQNCMCPKTQVNNGLVNSIIDGKQRPRQSYNCFTEQENEYYHYVRGDNTPAQRVLFINTVRRKANTAFCSYNSKRFPAVTTHQAT